MRLWAYALAARADAGALGPEVEEVVLEVPRGEEVEHVKFPPGFLQTTITKVGQIEDDLSSENHFLKESKLFF